MKKKGAYPHSIAAMYAPFSVFKVEDNYGKQRESGSLGHNVKF